MVGNGIPGRTAFESFPFLIIRSDCSFVLTTNNKNIMFPFARLGIECVLL